MLSKYPLTLLLLISLVVFSVGIWTLPVTDRDEAHFAQATKQMLETNRFDQVRFQQATRFQKPPGINWVQAIFVKLSGQPLNDIWPYRLASVAGGLFSVIGLFLFSSQIISKEAAVMASFILASTLLLCAEAHIALIDAELLLAVVLMQGALWYLYHFRDSLRHKWIWQLLFWLAMSYGFLLKGVTPLVGCLTIFTLCMSERSLKPLNMTAPLWGGLLFLLSTAWVLYVSDAEGTNYLLKMIQKDLLPKLTGGHESHGQLPLFHLAILPITFWPSSIFLLLGFSYAYQNRDKKNILFLICWLLPTWLFFELMPTKLPQYILPTFPAIALLCALGITEPSGLIKAKYKYVYRALVILWLLLSFVIASLLVVVPLVLSLPMNMYLLISAMIIAVLSLFMAYHAFYFQLKKTLYFCVLTAAIAMPIFFYGLLTSLKPLWITQDIERSLLTHPDVYAKITDKHPLLAVGYHEPSLAFVIGTQRVRYIFNPEVFKHIPDVMLIPSDMLAKLGIIASQKGYHYTVIKRLNGINYNKGRWLNLMLVDFTKRG